MKEVVRQLRLRDIGGIIVIDFIDMANPKNRETVEEALRSELERDRTKTYVVEISPLGLVEMTRQNVTDGPREILTTRCPVCAGDGIVVSDATHALEVERKLRAIAKGSRVQAFRVAVHPACSGAPRRAGRIAGSRSSRPPRAAVSSSCPPPTDGHVHLDHFEVLAPGQARRADARDAGRGGREARGQARRARPPRPDDRRRASSTRLRGRRRERGEARRQEGLRRRRSRARRRRVRDARRRRRAERRSDHVRGRGREADARASRSKKETEEPPTPRSRSPMREDAGRGAGRGRGRDARTPTPPRRQLPTASRRRSAPGAEARGSRRARRPPPRPAAEAATRSAARRATDGRPPRIHVPPAASSTSRPRPARGRRGTREASRRRGRRRGAGRGRSAQAQALSTRLAWRQEATQARGERRRRRRSRRGGGRRRRLVRSRRCRLGRGSSRVRPDVRVDRRLRDRDALVTAIMLRLCGPPARGTCVDVRLKSDPTVF